MINSTLKTKGAKNLCSVLVLPSKITSLPCQIDQHVGHKFCIAKAYCIVNLTSFQNLPRHKKLFQQQGWDSVWNQVRVINDQLKLVK